MVLQQLDATDRMHHADAQAKSQAGAVTWHRDQAMIAIVYLTERLVSHTHSAKKDKKRQQCQGI